MLINEGFDDYLGKPINIPNLERLFKKYIPEDKISYDNDISEHSTSVDTTSERADYNFLKSVLPNLDIDSGIANCGSSLKEYLKILKITYDYGPKQIAELKAALDTKDYTTYIIKIHSLKSTTLNIGAINLSAKARNQEEEGHKGNYDYIDEHFEDFYNGYNRLIDNLKTALEHFGMINNAPAEDTSVLSNEIVTRALKTIDTHIDNFDFGRVFAILEEIHKCQLPDEFKGLFDRISTLMDELDVDEIKEIIKDYI
jgi:HPt (histidine-containing phosphotransfer) domain-containing protein